MNYPQITIQDIHIGFVYEEYELETDKFKPAGYKWVTKRYGLKSPRLFKMQRLIKDGLIRKAFCIKMLEVMYPSQRLKDDLLIAYVNEPIRRAYKIAVIVLLIYSLITTYLILWP